MTGKIVVYPTVHGSSSGAVSLYTSARCQTMARQASSAGKSMEPGALRSSQLTEVWQWSWVRELI